MQFPLCLKLRHVREKLSSHSRAQSGPEAAARKATSTPAAATDNRRRFPSESPIPDSTRFTAGSLHRQPCSQFWHLNVPRRVKSDFVGFWERGPRGIHCLKTKTYYVALTKSVTRRQLAIILIHGLFAMTRLVSAVC